MSHLNEEGDRIFQEYSDNINSQVKEEQQLSEDINALANKSNMVLSAKLNANKGDFDRLRKLGTTFGTQLENKVKSHD